MIPHAFNQSELLARGWTLRRITVFLGLPDYMAQGRTRPYCWIKIKLSSNTYCNSATPKNEKCWRYARVIAAEADGVLTKPLPNRVRLPLS